MYGKNAFIRNGCPRPIADYIVKAYDDRVLSEYVVLQVREMGGKASRWQWLRRFATTRHLSPNGCSTSCHASTTFMENSMR